MKKHLPNFLTCCNLLCGAVGVGFIFRFGTTLNEDVYEIYDMIPAAVFVWVACVFDFLDGFVARKLNVSSPIGKELDSLADMISFGLLPSVFMFDFIRDQRIFMSGEFRDSALASYLPFVAFLIVVFSALRLAIFNVDETQRDSFRGLPTPANALFLTALPFFNIIPDSLMQNPVFLVAVTIGSSLILVSRVELFALKFKTFKWAGNEVRFTFLLLAVLLLVFFQIAAIPLIILLYIVLSLGSKAFPAKTQTP